MTFYLGTTPEAPVKPTTIFYYGSEGAEAKALAFAERTALRVGFSRDATTFDGIVEPCSRVVIMPSVAKHLREKITTAYGDKVGHPVADDALKTAPVSPEPRVMAALESSSASYPADGIIRETLHHGPVVDDSMRYPLDAPNRPLPRPGRQQKAPV